MLTFVAVFDNPWESDGESIVFTSVRLQALLDVLRDRYDVFPLEGTLSEHVIPLYSSANDPLEQVGFIKQVDEVIS